jgi:two-component system, OmpR family, response regulator RpaB
VDPRPLVLYADDDATLRAMFADAALAHGFRVALAIDGAEVVPLVERERPDVIVLDVMMPRLDGPGTLIALREQGQGQIPVVILSAVGGPFTREHCLALGAVDYRTKPFAPEEFFKRLAALVTAARSRRSGAA